MKARPHASNECMLAALLLIASGTGVLWLRHEATSVNATTATRRHELDRLVGIDRSVGGVPDLAAFGGHFAGHELVWTMAPTGAYLAIRQLP